MFMFHYKIKSIFQFLIDIRSLWTTKTALYFYNKYFFNYVIIPHRISGKSYLTL